MNKKMREISAKIEVLNEEAQKLFTNNDFDGAETKIKEIEDLEREYKIASKLFSEDKERVPVAKIVEKSKTVDKVKNFVENIKKVKNNMNESAGADGGYTVSEDVLTDIEKFRDAKYSLIDEVSVENTTKMSGKRTYKKRSSQKGFSKVGEGQKIGSSNTPKYDKYEYNIEKYAGILPVTNELFEDSDANIYNEIVEWIGDESRVTRNILILDEINKKEKFKLTGLDDIKKALNVKLGQAFKQTSKIITNDDGLQYLDTLKNKDGEYLLQPSPSDPLKQVLCAGANVIPVRVIPNQDLNSTNTYAASTDTKVVEGKVYYTKSGDVYTVVSAPTGNPSTSSYYEVKIQEIPMIIGDLKEGIKFFDRKKLNIVSSNTATAGELNAFEDDLTLFRAIEREDVVTRDSDAFVNGYLSVEI